MIISARLLAALLGVFGIMAGGKAVLNGLAGFDVPMIIDNQFRFFAAIRIGVSVGLIICALNIKDHTLMLRILALTIIIGALGRCIGLIAYEQPDQSLYFTIFVEVSLSSLLIWTQSRIRQKK